MLKMLHRDVQNEKNSKKAQILSRFFKTGKGEYGEGDQFVGITVPQCRTIAKKYKDLSIPDLSTLIKSPIHEERLIALLIAVSNYKGAKDEKKKQLFHWYQNHLKWINNWDLVDLSAPSIMGAYLDNKDISVLIHLAHSSLLWERRIAVISTFYFIKKGRFKEILLITDILLQDKHDLIHKAVGWMLREVGKRCSQKVLEQYLESNSAKMPRTMLRYAIEKLSTEKKKKFMNKKITLIS